MECRQHPYSAVLIMYILRIFRLTTPEYTSTPNPENSCMQKFCCLLVVTFFCPVEHFGYLSAVCTSLTCINLNTNSVRSSP